MRFGNSAKVLCLNLMVNIEGTQNYIETEVEPGIKIYMLGVFKLIILF